MGRVIRKAQAQDIPALAKLLGVLFAQETDFASLAHDASKQEKALRLLLKESNSTIFVAEVDGAVIGMISLFTFISTALGEPATLVEDFVVAEGHRGQGIGKALMDAVKAHVKDTGQHRITLLTDAKNSRGHKFYESEGFSRSAMVPWRYYQN